MPKLWDTSIQAHRLAVRDAVLDTAAALVMQHGLAAVTMSRIAKEAGIGRATLYKYYPDVEAIVLAWHARRIEEHVAMVEAVSSEEGTPLERLRGTLEAFVAASSHEHAPAIGALLHRGEHVARARSRIADLLEQLIAEAAAAGEVRTDVPAAELAAFCLAATSAGREHTFRTDPRTVVDLTLTALRGR